MSIGCRGVIDWVFLYFIEIEQQHNKSLHPYKHSNFMMWMKETQTIHRAITPVGPHMPYSFRMKPNTTIAVMARATKNS